MEFLQFAQQNGNPSVYSNKYTLQNTPVLTKFKACDASLSPDAQMAFLKNQTGQDILINNNPQKHQLLGVSDQFTGSMQQYQPIMTIPLQQAHLYQQVDKQPQNMQYMFLIILVVLTIVHAFIYMKMQKFEYRLKYQGNSPQYFGDKCLNLRQHAL